MFAAMRYIEQNPLRARIMRSATKYRWSSAKAHVSGNDPTGIVDLTDWPEMVDGTYWKRLLAEPLDDVVIHNIMKNTQTGRPLGNERFIARYERKLKRRLNALPVGRPKKEK